jgi:hypothetical protein
VKHSYKRNGKEITVEQKTVGKKHQYIVQGHDDIYDSPMDSVTGILGYVDGTSTTPISRWAVKQAVEYAKKHCLITGDITGALNDARKQPDIMFKKAGDRGTRIHNAIESYLTGLEWKNELTEEDDHDKLEICFKKISDWINESGLKIMSTELPVYHKELMAGGAIDLVLSDEKSRIYVVDFKTGTSVYKKDALQVTAYISCLISMLEDGVEIWNRYDSYMPHGNDLSELEIGGAIFHIKEDKADVDIKHINAPTGTAFAAARLLYEYWLCKESELFHKVTI